MTQYIVDAFTDRVFSGNPAAVCIVGEWPDEQTMKDIARENNLSETAFARKESERYRLRWFTPTTEVNLCGHATLATSFVILNFYEPDAPSVEFETMSGRLKVTREAERFVMQFPRYELKEIPVTDAMERAFGLRPERAILGLDLICVFAEAESVRQMTPDQNLLAQLPGRIQNATAKGTAYDCVSRSFCPKLGIPEDPVCGSAHCQIADFWSQQLGKQEIRAFQASPRTGLLTCRVLDKATIAISGQAVLFSKAELMI